VGLGNVLPPVRGEYGLEVAFAHGSRLQYPDFTVEFAGMTRSGNITLWRFLIASGDGQVEVIARTGGARDVERFRSRGQEFMLDVRNVGDHPWTLAITRV
jgi:hypothetical protein